MPTFDFLACAGRTIILGVTSILPIVPGFSQSGPRDPGNASGWSNPSRVATNDDSYATLTIFVGGSGVLTATGFGFSIPATHAIDGFVVEIDRSCTALLAGVDQTVQLIGNGTGTVNNYANTTDLWPSADNDVYEVYGGSTDTWGTLWTPAEVNSASFGVRVGAGALGGGTMRIDHIRITVYHHLAIVPITLSSFEAIVTNENSVRLDWSTESETNNDFFTIEKSRDGESYVAVANVGGSGNTNTPRRYSYEDRQPFTSRSYYRLKQTDFDGTYTYTKTVKVDYDGPTHPVLTILSNPKRDNEVRFRIVGVPDIPSLRMALFDLQGRILAQQRYEVTHPGVIEGKLKLSSPPPAGLYILKGGPGLQMTRKLMVR